SPELARTWKRLRALLLELLFPFNLTRHGVTRWHARVRAFSLDALQFPAAAGKAPVALLALQGAFFQFPRPLIPHEVFVAAFHRRHVKTVRAERIATDFVRRRTHAILGLIRSEERRVGNE